MRCVNQCDKAHTIMIPQGQTKGKRLERLDLEEGIDFAVWWILCVAGVQLKGNKNASRD